MPRTILASFCSLPGKDKGRRADGRNLIQEWQQGHDKRRYVWNAKQFAALKADASVQILGLF